MITRPGNDSIARTARRATQTALAAALAPIVIVQARRTKRRTPQLAPASGAVNGTVGGTDPKFRIVVIGESTAAGVGAPAHSEALPGHLADALHHNLQCSVAWSVAGKAGATARRVSTDLVPTLAGAAPDLVVVTIGINDLVRRRPLHQWAADLSELITNVQDRCEDAKLLLAGMPPVHRFPAIPQPLRLILGQRARAMDTIMQQVAQTHDATHVAMDPSMAQDHRMFAADGFHPSPAGYRAWATSLAAAA